MAGSNDIRLVIISIHYYAVAMKKRCGIISKTPTAKVRPDQYNSVLK